MEHATFYHYTDGECLEKGQPLFQEDLTRAMKNEEEMEYLSVIDFVVDDHAYLSAMREYLENRALQAWVLMDICRHGESTFLLKKRKRNWL